MNTADIIEQINCSPSKEAESTFLKFNTFISEGKTDWTSYDDLWKLYCLNKTNPPIFSERIHNISSESVKNVLKHSKLLSYSQSSVKMVHAIFNTLLLTFFERGEEWIIDVNGPHNKFIADFEALKSLFVEDTANSAKIKFLINSKFGGLEFISSKIEVPSIDLELNYGQDFLPKHKKIVDSINSRNSGLYIFRGAPGTGKSTYIKYLTSQIDKTFIYISESTAQALSSPELTELLSQHSNVILVIEDAERLVASREGGDSPVAALLNLTSGIAADALKIKFIITFNTEVSNIDKALSRKGRCLQDIEFENLSIDESKKLASHLGLDPSLITSEMPVGDIYHLNDESFVEKKKASIGFT